MSHDRIFGTIFPIVKVENLADDIVQRGGHNFRMARDDVDYAAECGKRLTRVRFALGYRKRPGLVRRMKGPLPDAAMRADADKLRKYENGVLPPPLFVIALENSVGEQGIFDYVFKDTTGRMSDEFRDKIRAEEQTPTTPED